MSAAQTDHFDHDCNGWQGGWCPGRLEAKSKDVGRSSNGDRASYLKCHRICTTLYFVGTGPVFLLYFFVFLCIATQFSCMQRFTIEFVLQQSILTVVQNTIPQATIAQVSPNCIYIPRFLYNTLHHWYRNVCTCLLIKDAYTTNLFCCHALSNPFPVFRSAPDRDNF